jgi:menaquinone-specific isochorismate synthase
MNTIINSRINITKILDNLQRHLEIIRSLHTHSLNIDKFPLNLYKKITNNGEKFKTSVSSVLEIIHANQLRKIVLADTLDVSANHDFNLLQSLNNLRQIHPNCNVFSTSNGQGQNFIGASPERLISIHKRQLITDALAGSAPRGKTPTEDATNANNLVNSTKEKHEHKLVLDFITQHLSQLGLFPQVLAPRLRQLSNIQHLWTPISAVVPNNIHPLQIVAKLHPTPAVAGAARDIACAEIRRYESFERGLYAAPLGWVDGEGNCEFIVGIRSALIDGNYARLYAGAGIVAGSDPQKEFAEVQLKLQALLKALV